MLVRYPIQYDNSYILAYINSINNMEFFIAVGRHMACLYYNCISVCLSIEMSGGAKIMQNWVSPKYCITEKLWHFCMMVLLTNTLTLVLCLYISFLIVGQKALKAVSSIP
jgi:hypothetical protein